jgi:hypothetical protein
VLADRELGFENVKLVLDKDQQFADLTITATGEAMIERGCNPEGG